MYLCLYEWFGNGNWHARTWPSESYHCCCCDLANLSAFALVWQSETCFAKLSPVTYSDISILASELELMWLLHATGACDSTLLCLKILIPYFWRVLIASLLCLSSGLFLHYLSQFQSFSSACYFCAQRSRDKFHTTEVNAQF